MPSNQVSSAAELNHRKSYRKGFKEPGFIEADTVAHCGTSLAGEFVNTLTMTDIFTGWTGNRGVFKKESRKVMGAIKSVEESLPFRIKGFASDN